jgi:hypothetical protein
LTDDRRRDPWSDEKSDGRAFLQSIAAVVGGLVALGLGVAGFSAYLDWSARENAHQFCDQIAIGSDASVASSRGRSRKVMTVADADSVDFIFPSNPFSSVTCHISVDRGGNVISKDVWISND